MTRRDKLIATIQEADCLTALGRQEFEAACAVGTADAIDAFLTGLWRRDDAAWWRNAPERTA